METNYKTVLKRILNDYSPVDDRHADLLMQHGTLDVLKKNTLLFQENRFNGFEYFQLAGISHRYNTDSENQLITSGIYSGETVITPHFARTRESLSIFSIQSLTACTFLKIPAGAFRELSDTHSPIRLFGRAVVEKEFMRGLNFDVLFRSAQAKERLGYFRSQYDGLENLIPHTVIASFLGITPVSFSRLRNELAKK